MDKAIKFEVSTPSHLFYKGDVEMIITRTLLGEEAFLINHLPVCKLLDTGTLRIREAGEKDFKVAVIKGGFIEVLYDRAVIFTDRAFWVGQDKQHITKNEAKKILEANISPNQKEADIIKAKMEISKADSQKKN